MTQAQADQMELIEHERKDSEVAQTRVTEDPLSMIARMVETGSNPDHLSVMVDLYERVTAVRARDAFNRDMAGAQADMPIVVRDKNNNQTNSRYAALETVQKQCKPVWIAHGFSLNFGQADIAQEGYIRVICDVRHREGHVERYHADGPIDDVGLKGNKNKTGMHATGSSFSYLCRYLICMVFNITIADDDNDGNGGGDCITDKQAIEINDMLREAGDKVDKDKFLAWAKADIVENIPASLYSQAIRFLRAKTEGK